MKHLLIFLALSILPATGVAQELPPALSGFKPIAANPVFEGQAGQWDELIRERGWVMKDGETFRMWYTGYQPDSKPFRMKLGYATSADGIHWKRHPHNPVYDEAWVEDMMVVQQGANLFMFAEGFKDQAHLLKSTDGIEWKRIGVLDVRLTTGEKIAEGPFGTPTAWFEDDTWYLFYERRDQGIWLATSQDMKVWTNVNDNPLIVPGPDEYDRLMIAMNQIVKIDNRYYAVLHGTGTPSKPRDWCTYIAVSDDLLHWQKCKTGPVLPIKDNKSSGVLVRDGEEYVLYTMHGKVDRHERRSAK